LILLMTGAAAALSRLFTLANKRSLSKEDANESSIGADNFSAAAFCEGGSRYWLICQYRRSWRETDLKPAKS
jgi:hypothetical protein